MKRKMSHLTKEKILKVAYLAPWVEEKAKFPLDCLRCNRIRLCLVRRRRWVARNESWRVLLPRLRMKRVLVRANLIKVQFQRVWIASICLDRDSYELPQKNSQYRHLSFDHIASHHPPRLPPP